jgi:hypothetical protein
VQGAGFLNDGDVVRVSAQSSTSAASSVNDSR